MPKSASKKGRKQYTATDSTSPVVQLSEDLARDGAPVILTLREAANYGRLHYQTAWELTQSQQFPAFKRGGRWLVQRSELARWILNGSY